VGKYSTRAIITDDEDVNGRSSGFIAPHGICALWEPNEIESLREHEKSEEEDRVLQNKGL
jgi:hypothetical protein